MKRWNQLLVLAIVAVLLVPSAIVGTLAEACCGVDVKDLVVTDEPDPVCVGDPVTISGTYVAYTEWDPWTEPYDTGVEIRIYDSDGNMVDEYLETLGTNLPSPGPQPGTEWPFSHDWTPTTPCETWTYEVIAWAETMYGRMETDIVGGTITAEYCEAQCPTIDPCVEWEIRARWTGECPSCAHAKNHGEYVACRATIVDEYVEMCLVDEEGSSCLINPEARSDCPPK